MRVFVWIVRVKFWILKKISKIFLIPHVWFFLLERVVYYIWSFLNWIKKASLNIQDFWKTHFKLLVDILAQILAFLQSKAKEWNSVSKHSFSTSIVLFPIQRTCPVLTFSKIFLANIYFFSSDQWWTDIIYLLSMRYPINFNQLVAPQINL